MEGHEQEGVAVPIVWSGPEDVPILVANAFVCQFDSETLDAFILTVGQLTPPALVGANPEEIRRQAEQISYVPVKPVARFGLSVGKMRELIAILAGNLEQLEAATTMRPGDPR